ncbi:MAG: TolC family outer membrane protein [Magnetococcales bacterium]|nr:TolC family outer membrane protein [Magnetococcales bacterium]
MSARTRVVHLALPLLLLLSSPSHSGEDVAWTGAIGAQNTEPGNQTEPGSQTGENNRESVPTTESGAPSGIGQKVGGWFSNIAEGTSRLLGKAKGALTFPSSSEQDGQGEARPSEVQRRGGATARPVDAAQRDPPSDAQPAQPATAKPTPAGPTIQAAQAIRKTKPAESKTEGADASHSVQKIYLLGGDDLLRIQVEADKGAIAEAELDASGNSLRLGFAHTNKESLTNLVSAIRSNHPLVQGVSVIQPKGQSPYLSIQLHKPVTILDETLVTLPDGRSRWDMMLSPLSPFNLTREEVSNAAKGLPPATGPILGSLEMGVTNKLLNIMLLGNPQLTAEVSFLTEPHRLIVDLPRVSLLELQGAVARFQTKGSMPSPNIAAIRIGEREQGVGRLIFDLLAPMDLVQSGGTIVDHVGRISMSLVPDGPPVEGNSTPPLKAIELRDEINGKASLQLTGLQGTLQISSYALRDPSRLMLDFIGFKPEQLYDAVARFKALPQVVRAVRYGETRLGSARVELTLAKGARVANLVVRRGEENGNVIVASLAPRDPTGGELAESVIGPDGEPVMNLHYQPDHDFRKKPTIVIKPVQLPNAGRFDKQEQQPSGLTLDLLSFFERAMNNDAQYQAAKADYLANSEAKPQAVAGYLPTVSYNYQQSEVRQDIIEAMNASFPTGSSDFGKKTMSLSITQPLIQVQKLLRLGQAKVAVTQAETNLLATEQELMVRVATAYLNMLAAKDGLDLARKEREATEKQAEQAVINYESGLATQAQFHEAEGRAALTQSREIKANNQWEDARNALKEIIGETVESVQPFKEDFEAAPPHPNKVEPWVSAALKQNLALQTRIMAQEIADMEVSRQRAGYLPTVDLVGSVEKEKATGSIYGSGQNQEQTSLGVRINVPVFEGGMTASLVRESLARREKVAQELEQERRRTERFTRAAFQSVQESSKSLGALRKMTVAQESALQARLVGYESGLETVITVLDAFRLYYASRRDYLQARYEYLINRLKLKQAIGSLERSDLEDLANLLRKGKPFKKLEQ